MKLLAIDTSTEYLSIAVGNKDKIFFEKTVLLKAKFSDKIMGLIDLALKKSKSSVSNIDGFVVGLGPGSFTSLRVGLSTIKGIAFAAGKPVVGISSLDAIAMNASGNAEVVCVMTDARRKLIYSTQYRKCNGSLERQGEYHLGNIDETLKKLPKQKDSVLLIGDALANYEEDARRIVPTATWAQSKHWNPKASALIRLAESRFEKKDFDDVDTLLPLYLYAEDCQVQK